jgi:hypothetical protein
VAEREIPEHGPFRPIESRQLRRALTQIAQARAALDLYHNRERAEDEACALIGSAIHLLTSARLAMSRIPTLTESTQQQET